MRVAKPDDTTLIQYVYDALGRRIAKNVDGAGRRLYYNDKWQITSRYVVSGGTVSPEESYVYGNYIDEVLLLKRSNVNLYYVHDQLYSPVALVNANGDVAERYEYDAYGKATIYDGSWQPILYSYANNPFFFTGREVDYLDNGNLALQYNRHRYYSQSLGRWTSEDPTEYVDGLNLYEYIQSRPIADGDPYGLQAYIRGNYDLTIAHDVGSGTWGATAPATLRQITAKSAWSLVAIGANLYGYHDAALNMMHYLGNTGSDLTIDYSRLIRDVPRAQEVRDSEINEAVEFAEGESGESFQISSTRASGGDCPRSVSPNWYYAVNGYSTWGKAYVSAKCDDYKMTFALKFEDMYNWDVGKGATIFGKPVPDTDLGELHRAGIAREYLMKGEVMYTVTWHKGERIGGGAQVTGGR